MKTQTTELLTEVSNQAAIIHTAQAALNQAIVAAKNNGATYAQLAEALGCSRGGAQYTYQRLIGNRPSGIVDA